MKSGTPRKAPKVTILPKDKPNFMKEYTGRDNKRSPQAPMGKKRLSK